MTNESTNETMHMVGLVVVRGSILTLFCEMRRSALLLLLSQIRAGGIGSARVRADFCGAQIPIFVVSLFLSFIDKSNIRVFQPVDHDGYTGT
jgi:hypothetical protein